MEARPADSHMCVICALPPLLFLSRSAEDFHGAIFFGCSTASMEGVGALEKRIHWPWLVPWMDPGEPRKMWPG
jgi:hypothetical protein